MGAGPELGGDGRLVRVRVAVLPGSPGTPVSHEPLPGERVAPVVPVGVLPPRDEPDEPGEPAEPDDAGAVVGGGDGVGVVTTPVGGVGGYGAGVPARAAPVAMSASVSAVVSAAVMSSATRACVVARTADPATYFPRFPRPAHR